MAKRKINQKVFCDRCSDLYAKVVNFFALWILLLLPLIITDFYFNILETKYMFFWVSVITMLAVLIVMTVCFCYQDYELFNGINTKRILHYFKPTELLRHCNAPDIAMMAFLLIAIVSTLQSDYLYESFWGNEGRYTGLFLLMLYGVMFFSVTKLMKFKRWHIDAFLVVVMLVCLFGITDYFQMDILHFKVRLKASQWTIFTSTIGNVNTYASFVGLGLGAVMTLFAIEKNRIKTIIYYIGTIIAMTALFMGLSDNAYLALLALYGFMPLYLFRKKTGVRRYVVLVATIFTVVKVLTIINRVWSDKVVGLDSLFLILADMKLLVVIIVALWSLAAVLYFSAYNKKDLSDSCSPWLIRGWLVVLVVVIATVIFMIWDVNKGGHVQRYGALERYLVLDDEWGTHRGYIWRIAVENYMKFPLIHKLFGYGPDTFGILTIQNNYKEMTSLYKETFDSAHNEYLQYFVTMGIFGLTAYIGLLVTSAVRMLKNALDKPEVMAAFFACVAYAAQAFVNISVPIVAPVMWVLLMTGLSGCRDVSVKTKE
ncbi:MAG: O-antigen ligase family protein [Clostridiaceae bacterium]|nr:O-antigen ligase family protein [Clostridiaceae bacterium]